MEPRRSQNGESSSPLVGSSVLGYDGLFPQLFTSVPSLNDATSYLAQTTSYITSCFSDYSVDYTSGESEDSLLQQQELELVGCHSGQNGIDPDISDLFFSRGSTAYATSSSGTATPSAAVPAGNSSADANSLALSNYTGPSGISMFQGLIERARRTVRGSADDIGWLQRAPGLPPVEDGTEKFTKILEDIRHGIHRLPTSVVYLLVPGLFSNHGPMYFVSTKTGFSKMGLTCHITKIHSEASVEKNAREIKEYIEEIYWGAKKKVVLLGHSKGGIDSAAALSLYWPDLKDKVAGLAIAQSPYGGTPVASDILREGQLGDYVSLRKIMEILISKVIKGDIQALEDLTYEKRKEFMTKHKLPPELPVVSFHTEAGITPTVVASLSHVAHAELGQSAKLPVVIPLGAAMAACARLLQARYGEKSDGLVTCRDAEVPGSVVVHPTRKLDHAWMVYSTLSDDPSEADASQVCEALLTLLVEVSEKKWQDSTTAGQG
ncbi:hypothetical protein MLD38_018705 [Melastoma candidum]|uniref:Uncharacterized protein n=1 Tax=Melastoma candidum TaxID=119954 RepID=A0ACB9R2X3_9MYRT|nr:hypothetical protein MLD38_018705 [Melastoma candidum]